MIPATLIAIMGWVVCWNALPALAGDYRVTHLVEGRVFAGTTLLADMSDPRQPKVVEVDFNGDILWRFNPPRFHAGRDSGCRQAGKRQRPDHRSRFRHL